MLNDVERVLITEQEIAEKVKEIGEKITNDYQGEQLLIVTILKGSVVFAADLLRQIKIPVEIDFMCLSSYGCDSKSSGVVRIVKDLNQPIEGKNVLIIEDILDSGNTLSHLTKLLSTRNPKSVKIVTLLDKPERRTAPVEVTYKGFTIPDEFVVGYGLDYNEKYRNIPFVGVLKREVYE